MSSIPRTRAAGRILRYARRHAGLTQRALAEKAGIPQETIARIEASRTSPRYDTLSHLLRACGFELELEAKKGVGVDVSQIQALLALTASERARFAASASEGVRDLVRRSRRLAEDVRT